MSGKEKADTSSSSGLQIALHPLVLINVSDHHTRAKVRSAPAPAPRCLGVLLGVQKGRSVEIHTTFEILYTQIEGDYVIDTTFLKTRAEQYSKVFPTYEILGWYSTGSGVEAQDQKIHRAISSFNENPLYLLLNPNIPATERNLPIKIFESVLHITGEQAEFVFVETAYKVDSGEAERIAVDHVAHEATGSGQSESSLVTYFGGMQNAVRMLHSRLTLLERVLVDTSSGKLPKDHAMLRQVSSLCSRLPAVDQTQFQHDFSNEYNDALLITYLTSMTKGTQQLTELVDKFQMAHEKQNPMRRQRGHGF